MELAEFFRRNAKEVDRELGRFLPKRVNEKWLNEHFGRKSYDADAVNKFLNRPVWDLLERGGKRWRPMLMFLGCGAVGGNPKSIRRFSVIPELIHNGTLIADDVEDNSRMRRNGPAVHVSYGLDTAVNLGSMLYYLPLLAVKSSGLGDSAKLKIYELVNEEMLNLHIGQGTDIYWHKSAKKVSEKQYFSMCANKTGTLARLAAKLGAILGDGHKRQVEALGKFAEGMGISFQIQDDILNLRGGIGKNLGEDITEGKASLPVIRAMRAAAKQEKNQLAEILKKHTHEKREILMAVGIIRKCGALEYSAEAAGRIAEKSWKEIDSALPAS